MFSPRGAKNETKSSFTFPTIKQKNIVCIFCKCQFYVRDLNVLRGPHVPLLLRCGHASCYKCIDRHAKDACPLCNSSEPTSSQVISKPPLNVYIVGLIGSSHASPNYGDEADLSFSTSSVPKIQTSEPCYCFECGMSAFLRCHECDTLFCSSCYGKTHAKFKTLMNHHTTLLPNPRNDPIFQLKTCDEHKQPIHYYCSDCCFSSCSECMLLYHHCHKVLSHSVVNQEYIPEFSKVEGEMVETLQRIRQAQKKVQNLLVTREQLQKREDIEKAVNQHFTYLHGLLQNIESRLIDNLYEQRKNVVKNLNDIQEHLKIQESQLQSALLMRANRQVILSKMNLKEIIPKLKELADAPCYLVQDEILDTDNIEFYTDPSIVKTLEKHCQIDVPKNAVYNLLRKATLPEGYEVEPLNTGTSSNLIDDVSLTKSSIMKPASSNQSLVFHRPERGPLREGGFSLVKICHIEHPSNFYVCRVSSEQKSLELKEMLHNYATQTDAIPNDVVQKNVYIVKHQTNGKWYRGKIKSINSNGSDPDTYQVFDIDNGSIEDQVRKECLRSITKPLRMIEILVFKCALFGVVPINGKWSPEACQALASYQEPLEPVRMHILKITGNTHYVDLRKERSTNNCVSIRDYLVLMDCAVFNNAHQLLRIAPQAVQRFYREDFTLNSYHTVKITHVESPDCIYVQKVDNYSNYLENMRAEMHAYYTERTRGDAGMIHVPEIGIACAAEVANGVWRRAIIKEVRASRKVSVILVDFGPTITVDFEKIRELPENFMVASTQAIKVSLAHIKPIGDEWSEEAKTLISPHFQYSTGRLFAFERDGDACTVSLYTSTKINVAALLVAKGLAISTGPR